DTDRGRSSVCASDGVCSSRNAANSARKASTSSSKVSCTILLRDERAVLFCAAEHQLACFRAFDGKLQIVLPRQTHGAEALHSVPDNQRLGLACSGFRHPGEQAATRIVGGNGERREV